MHHDIYVLLPHPTETRLLLQPGGEGWTLPLLQLELQERVVARTASLLTAIRAQLGIEATVLRRIRAYGNPYGDGVTRLVSFFEVENHSPATTLPADSRWVGIEDIGVEQMQIPDPRQREMVEAWFAAHTEPVPPLRAAWARKGWFAHAAEWIDTQLASRGYTPTGPVEQFKQWGISAVLRVPTTDGLVFFKALPPFFAIEPVITDALSRWYPDYLPRVLAIEPSQRWMLQHAFSGEVLEDAGRDAWEIALRELAQIQVECVPRVPDLLRLGCADRRLEVLAGQIDPLFHDPTLQALSGLETDEITRLRALAPRLKALCATIAGYGIPATLAHGDFHSGNVVVSGDHCILYDWSDACVSHPFFDLHTVFLSNYPDARRDDTPHLRDTYLSAWSAFAPSAQLVAAFEQSKPLNALHQAVSYKNILEGLEPDSRAELRGGLTYWLQMILE